MDANKPRTEIVYEMFRERLMTASRTAIFTPTARHQFCGVFGIYPSGRRGGCLTFNGLVVWMEMVSGIEMRVRYEFPGTGKSQSTEQSHHI